MLDDFDLSAIRQKIHHFYSVRKEVPTLSKLLAVLKEDINYDGGKEHLRQSLKKMGLHLKSASQIERLY